LIFTGSVAAFLAWRLVWVLDLPAPYEAIGTGAVYVFVGLILAGMVLPRVFRGGAAMDLLARLANLNMGLLSLVLTGVVLRDLVWVGWDLLSGIPAFAACSVAPRLDRFLVLSDAVILGGGLVVVAWGWKQARSTPAVCRVELVLPGLAPALHGFRIVQLSDIHMESTTPAGWLRLVVERANACKPDLVVITGDLVDGSVAALASCVAPVADLQSRHGIWFITGNHEYYSDAAPWITHLEALGIPTLINAHTLIEHDGGRLLLAGVPDHDGARFIAEHRPNPAAALASAPAHDVTILLAHQPRTALLAQGLGVDLMLSGHTHGGQIWPWMHLVWLQQPMKSGLRRLGDVLVYTSRGTGHWGPPLRLGAPAEITEILLRPSPQADHPSSD